MGSIEAPVIKPALKQATSAQDESRWPAQLSLTVAKTARGSRLVKKSHAGPLYVQKPFYPEGPNSAHIYLLHPPGGIVSGDHLGITIDLQAQAHGLFTTPGAGRIYKARPDQTPQCQTVQLSVAPNAVLEWLPLETIVFPASNGQLTTQVTIPSDGSGRFIGWEITALGLPASQFPFNSGQLHQSFALYQGTKPLLIETLRLNAKDINLLQGRCGLQSRPVSALMVAGPFSQSSDDFKALITRLREQVAGYDTIGITSKHQFIIIRLLTNNAEHARKTLTQLWQILRPELIGLPATEPRIWAC